MSEAAVQVPPQDEDERQRIDAMRTLGLLDPGEDEPFDRLAELARQLLGVESALVSFVSHDKQVFKGQAGVRPDLEGSRETSLDYSYCKYAVASGMPLLVSDARESALLRESPAIRERDAISYAGVPLAVEDGTVFGTLCVLSSTPREWTPEELERLEALAAVVRGELQRRLEHRRMQEVEVLADRLEEPVARLGDTIRTAATLAEDPGDPRLPRVTDQARERLQSVETLTQDLGHAVRQGRSEVPVIHSADLTAVLQRTLRLAGSLAREQNLQAQTPEEPIHVTAAPGWLGRGLSFAVTSLLHHLPPERADARVDVLLDPPPPGGPATVVISGPGVLPAGEVLRLAGQFRSLDGEELPLDVRYAGGGMRARNEVALVSVSPESTRIVVTLPLERA